MIRVPQRRTVGDRTGYELGVEESRGGRALGRRSVRFASGDTKEAATAQPRTDEVKIGSKPRYVNPPELRDDNASFAVQGRHGATASDWRLTHTPAAR